MAMTPRRRDQGGKPVKELIHAELEVLPAIGARFRYPIDQALALDTPAQALE